MADPVVLRCTDKFIEILDSNASSFHVLRLDAIMHVRSSNSHVFLSTNTLNASISFTFKDTSKVAPFINKIVDTLGKDVSFRQIEQDMTSLSEKFEEFKNELVPTVVELIEQDRVSLSEKFEEFKKELEPSLLDLIDQDRVSLSEKFEAFKNEMTPPPKEPLFPEPHSSPACEAVIMLVSLFLLYLFLLPLTMNLRQ